MRVPLHEAHAALGARFVDFAGFEMPVQYSSIIEEHHAVRSAVGVFDVSHMSNVWVVGRDAEALVSRVMGSDPAPLPVGRGSYTVMTRDDGSIIDDVIYYKFAPDLFHVVPNAGRNQDVVTWMQEQASGDVDLEDVSREYCILAVQGPGAPDVLRSAAPAAAGLKRFRVEPVEGDPRNGFVSGTGYTGERGGEVVLPNDAALAMFEKVLAQGAKPVGLGARDTLRLEKGFCLASHEFEGGRTPLEAGLEWTLSWEHDFIGRDALLAKKKAGSHEALVGLRLTEKGVPRQGHDVVDASGSRVGRVTSGTLSPTLNEGIALAYVAPTHSQPGLELGIQVRGRRLGARIAKLPFV